MYVMTLMMSRFKLDKFERSKEKWKGKEVMFVQKPKVHCDGAERI